MSSSIAAAQASASSGSATHRTPIPRSAAYRTLNSMNVPP